jgi:hypothetical protein
MLFLIGLYYFYGMWQKSSKSYWLFGETARNSRYLLLAGVMLSGLMFTSLLITLFAIPVFINFAKICIKDWAYGARQAIVLFTPSFLQGWLWYSYFASRNLLTDAFRAAGLDFRLTTHGTGFNPSKSIVIVFPILLLIAFVLQAVRRDNFVKDRKTWIIGFGVLEGLAVSRGGILVTLPLIFLLVAPLYFKKMRLGYVALWCMLGLLFVLPYRYQDSSSAKLAVAQAQFAETYVEQRLEDSNYIIYYGRGAGFFANSNVVSSSRFYNAAVFPFDTDTLQLVDKFRGDNEANTPLFVVYATDDASRVQEVPRIEEYFKKHYEEVTTLPGYKILKRK